MVRWPWCTVILIYQKSINNELPTTPSVVNYGWTKNSKHRGQVNRVHYSRNQCMFQWILVLMLYSAILCWFRYIRGKNNKILSFKMV